MSGRTTRAVVGATAVLSFAVAGSIAYATAGRSGPVLHGCSAKDDGALRLARVCKATERAVTWGVLGPQGPAGQPGPMGPAGKAGVVGSVVDAGTPVTSAATAPRGTTIAATAMCPTGKVLLGGGAKATTSSPNASDVALEASYPSSGTTWTAIAAVGIAGLPAGATLTVQAFIVCTA